MKKILKSPYLSILAMPLGILVGIYFPWISSPLTPLKVIYTNFLSVCSIPLLITVVILSMKKLLKNNIKKILPKWILRNLITIFIVSVFVVLVFSMLRPIFSPDTNTKIFLFVKNEGNSISESFSKSELEFYNSTSVSNKEQFSVTDYLVNIIPSNIFASMANDQMLQVLIFIIIFGILLTKIDEKYSSPAYVACEGVFLIMKKWLSIFATMLAPIATFIMFAITFSDSSSLQVLKSMSVFITLNITVILSIVFLCMVCIKIFIGFSLKGQYRALKDVFWITISMKSKNVSIPILIKKLQGNIDIPEEILTSTMYIGPYLIPFGHLTINGAVAIYAAEIYSVNLDLSKIIILVVSTILYSFCSNSVPVESQLSILYILLQPLGIPSQTVYIIMLIAVKLYSGLSVLVNLYIHLAITSSLVAKKKINAVAMKKA